MYDRAQWLRINLRRRRFVGDLQWYEQLRRSTSFKPVRESDAVGPHEGIPARVTLQDANEVPGSSGHGVILQQADASVTNRFSAASPVQIGGAKLQHVVFVPTI